MWEFFYYICGVNKKEHFMATYIGEFDCKIDSKGRMMIPAGLFKQFPTNMREKFVINRSVFQKCLILYPMDCWGEIMKDLGKLNRFQKKTDDFIRQYLNGATEVELDSSNRLLIPKKLSEYATIDKDIVLSSSLDKIEIWSSALHNDILNNYNHDDFAKLAEEVMGKINNNDADGKDNVS
jgi:MraZ protein